MICEVVPRTALAREPQPCLIPFGTVKNSDVYVFHLTLVPGAGNIDWLGDKGDTQSQIHSWHGPSPRYSLHEYWSQLRCSAVALMICMSDFKIKVMEGAQ